VTDHVPDRQLLMRLRAADPASSLPPVDPDRVVHLLEEAMSDTATRPHESRETGTHGRSPLTWLVAAAAVVLIAAAGIFGLANRDHGSQPASQGSVTRLAYAPHAGRCMVPSVAVLKQQTVAFRGTLVSMAAGSATFDVSHWYAGGPTDTAKVSATPTRLGDLVQAAKLTVGSDYLVSASGGDVTACGFSGPAAGSLQRLYDQAFG
jgi:hypothetical protein